MVTVTNSCLEQLAKLYNGVSVAPFKYRAVGTGSSFEAVTDTFLTTEVTDHGMGRQMCTCEYEETYIAKNSTTFTNNGLTSVSVLEVGEFDTAVSGGNMAWRHKYETAKVIAPGEGLQIIMRMTMARAP